MTLGDPLGISISRAASRLPRHGARLGRQFVFLPGGVRDDFRAQRVVEPGIVKVGMPLKLIRSLHFRTGISRKPAIARVPYSKSLSIGRGLLGSGELSFICGIEQHRQFSMQSARYAVTLRYGLPSQPGLLSDVPKIDSVERLEPSI
jgi:hypothetical protein